jgi:hypothetical protein
MLLFGRRRTMNPDRSRAAVGFAMEVAGRVREVSGQDVFAWTTVWSPPAGTILWSARVEHLSQLETVNEKMAADTGLMDFIEEAGDLFVGPVSDSLIQVVHGTPDAAPMSYVGVVQATCLPGKLSGAMAFGAEVADAVTRVTGRSCLFCASLSGDWGGVSWITGSPDADSLQEDNDTWSGDAGAVAMMDKAGEFFQPAASTTFLRRLA